MSPSEPPETGPAERPAWADFRAEVAGLVDDLHESIALRCELARLELSQDVQTARRSAVMLAAALAPAFTALPLVALCAAEWLDAWLGIARTGWLLVFAAVLFPGGLLGAWLVWRRFCRRVLLLQETIEEIREDGRWLREWTLQQKPQSMPKRV